MFSFIQITGIVTLKGCSAEAPRSLALVNPRPLFSSGRRDQDEVDSDFEVLMKTAHSFGGSRDELNRKDHGPDKTSRLKQRYLEKKTEEI